jgi:hypothetical protein
MPRAKAVNFLLKVQSRMLKAVRDWRDVVVRMEITAAGAAPNYRFERPTGEALLTIDGRKHKPLENDRVSQEVRSWSTATMSFQEVSETARELAAAEFEQLLTAARKKTKAPG